MKILLYVITAAQGLHGTALIAYQQKKSADHHSVLHDGGDSWKTVKSSFNEPVYHQKDAGGGYKKGSPLYDQEQQQQRHQNQGPQATVGDRFIGVSVYAFWVFLFAVLYKKFMLNSAGDATEPHTPMDLPNFTKCGFAFSLCDFDHLNEDWPMCCWACLCPVIQWSGNASKSQKPFLNYWQAIVIMLILILLYPLTYGVSAIVILGLVLARRRKLRQDYNHARSTPRSWMEDFCLVFCCQSLFCCQLVQEAREVEYTSPKQLEAGRSGDLAPAYQDYAP